MSNNFITVDGIQVPLEGERNLLEVIRKSGIELPTFCYHSNLSVYGACRMCICEVEGRGLLPTCSTPPEPGMSIKVNTEKTIKIRKTALELLLSVHNGNCQTCTMSTNCRLQELAENLGVDGFRFPNTKPVVPVDESSFSLVRDPNKCILCGDCVRMCKEIQGIGVLDFVGRGSTVRVSPAFNKDLMDVECVYCGQCSTCCPTGALTVKSDVQNVFDAIHDPSKTVIVHVAPAVRASVGEAFGEENSEMALNKAIAAMRRIGFDKVYDTCFTADLTTVEEATEFLTRVEKGGVLPQFTSCCPAWVKFCEQFYPEFLPNLSTCKSPMGMFGALARNYLPKELGVENKDLVVVTVMPCTAKKFEVNRPEMTTDGFKDNDYVLTTQELVKMIKMTGVNFKALAPESCDMPFGFKSGAGVIYGTTGGVAEAVLRMATHAGSPDAATKSVEFKEVRGFEGVKELVLPYKDTFVKLAVVNGLANTRALLEKIKSGEADYNIVEVMSCPGGCVGGAGQLLPNDMDTRFKRMKEIYNNDSSQVVHNAEDNPYIKELYANYLGEVNGHLAHKLLHTTYSKRGKLTGKVCE